MARDDTTDDTGDGDAGRPNAPAPPFRGLRRPGDSSALGRLGEEVARITGINTPGTGVDVSDVFTNEPVVQGGEVRPQGMAAERFESTRVEIDVPEDATINVRYEGTAFVRRPGSAPGDFDEISIFGEVTIDSGDDIVAAVEEDLYDELAGYNSYDMGWLDSVEMDSIEAVWMDNDGEEGEVDIYAPSISIGWRDL
jgi:hypothetical protein